jgi:hypothetical protein
MEWIEGVRMIDPIVHIVSLLGKKGTGTSEFKYYPFRSCEESNHKPIFQDWLGSKNPGALVVHEFPTTDYEDIPNDRIAAIRTCVEGLLARGSTVLLMDSAGAVRTRQVRIALSLTSQKAKLTEPCARKRLN